MQPFELATIILCFIGLIVGSITDLRKREIPDMINYGLFAIGLGMRIIFSIVSWDIMPLAEGAAGFAVAFAIACLMFYTGQWGGGDAKLLMALGMIIGLQFNMGNFLTSFIINSFVIGSVYGLLWGIGLAIKNWKSFSKKFSEIKKEYIGIAETILWFVFAMTLGIFFAFPSLEIKLLLMILTFSPILLVYLWVFAKATENSSMIKSVPPEKLTEGDWLYKDIKYQGKMIASKHDLGLEKKQISQLIALKKKKVIFKVLVKEGIPFTPSFLMAYLATLLLYYAFGIGNWLIYLANL